MKKVASIVACSVVAVMVAGVAMAGEGKGHKKGDFFAKADADKDGKLSLAEFKAANTKGDAEAKFAKADTNKDGFLTPEELKAARKAKKCADAPKPAEAPAAEAPAPAAK